MSEEKKEEFDASVPIVCDNGTGYVKVGWAGTNFPTATFPSTIGRPILRSDVKDKHKVVLPDLVMGPDVSKYRNFLQLSSPMSNGMITNWKDMDILWKYTFQDVLNLGKDSYKDRKIMLTEPPENPDQNRIKMAEAMFETFGFGAIQVQYQAVCALYAQGLMTGLVCDSGDGVTHCISVIEGFVLNSATKRLNIAGRDITKRLIELLQVRGYTLQHTADFDAVREIKEALCYVSYDLEAELKLARETLCTLKSYKLPDGRTIQLDEERFLAAEILFQPDLIHQEGKGVGEMVFAAIQDSPIDNRAELYKHIVLSGGTTMYPGFSSRLDKEMEELIVEKVHGGDRSRLVGSKIKVRVEDPPRRKHMVYLGAAILSDIMKEQDDFWLSQKDWKELGPKRALAKLKKK